MSEELTTPVPENASPVNTAAAVTDVPAIQPPAVTWPEDIPVCEAAQKNFLQLATQLALTDQQAQQLVDLECNFARLSRQEAEENAAQERARWAAETKDFYGPKWEEEVSRAVRAADEFGGAPLRKLLEETGLGNHLVIVRTFNEIGKRISEDSSASGIASAQGDKTFAEALYGNLK
jgi:hypothetical protein